MNDDSLFYYLDELMLAVLGLPVLAAAVVGLASMAGAAAACRAAGYLAAGQLALTAILVVIAGMALSAPGRTTVGSFKPVGVPGARAHSPDENSTNTIHTTWSVLSIGSVLPGKPGGPPPNVQFYLGLDGLNLPLVGLAGLMFFLAVLVSWDSVTDRPGGFFAWLFLLQAGVTGAFVAMDILLFYVFFELTLIPAFFLIGYWGVGAGKRDAARKFFLYTLFGSLFTLVGIIGVVLENPIPIHPYTGRAIPQAVELMADPANPASPRLPAVRGGLTFSIPRLVTNYNTWRATAAAEVKAAERSGSNQSMTEAREKLAERRSTEAILFFLLMAGFAVKIPLVPFHTWLPAAYSEAPLGVTMVLSAVVSKLGTFGVLRIVLPLCPGAAIDYGLGVAGVLGAIGIVYAAFCAYSQRDLKLLAAYSSVSHLGFLVIALFTGTTEGISGAVLHMVNHGLTAGALFALLAYLSVRYRTTDATAFGGLLAKHPAFAFYFIVLSLAAVGLPGLCSFVSEMLMLAGLFDPRNTAGHGYALAVTAAAGIFLSAWYTFTAVRQVFFGPVVEPIEPVGGGLTSRETVTLGGLTAMCLAIGLYPQPVLDVIASDAARVASYADTARGRLNPATENRPQPPSPPGRTATFAAQGGQMRAVTPAGGGLPPGGVKAPPPPPPTAPKKN